MQQIHVIHRLTCTPDTSLSQNSPGNAQLPTHGRAAQSSHPEMPAICFKLLVHLLQ